MSAPPLPQSASGQIYELMHGGCTPTFLTALHQALRRHPAPATADPAGRDARLTARLRQLARALPPARDLWRSPEQLATLIAWSAAAEPALCMTLINHTVLGLGSLICLAPDHGSLRRQFEALETGRTKCSYLITEIGQSNSHLATRTIAEFDPQTRQFTLTTPDQGAAKFSSTAAHGVPRTGVALARLTVAGQDCGVFPFLVNLTDPSGPLPGVEMTSPVELSALPLDYAYVRFNGVRLPWEHWLRDDATIGPDGVFHDPLGSPDQRLQRTLCVGQALWATLPAAASALARQAGLGAVRYARRRRTQGRLAPGAPLLDYRSQQHAVLGAMADAFALTCAASRALELWSAHQSARPSAPSSGADPIGFAPWSAVSQPLSAYKAHSVREAARITTLCQRHCGFAGLLDTNRLASYRGFLEAFEPAGGDSQLIFYDLGRALAEEAAAPLADDATALPRAADPLWWPALLRRHTDRLARRLRTRRDALAMAAGGHTTDSFVVWNPLLDEAAELGAAYAASLAAEDVTRTLAAFTDPETRARLEPLAALHGALAARRHAGSLLAAGTVSPADLEELAQTTDRLCDTVLPQLDWLEDAFALPADIVCSSLAAEDYSQAHAQTLTWKHGALS